MKIKKWLVIIGDTDDFLNLSPIHLTCLAVLTLSLDVEVTCNTCSDVQCASGEARGGGVGLNISVRRVSWKEEEDDGRFKLHWGDN